MLVKTLCSFLIVLLAGSAGVAAQTITSPPPATAVAVAPADDFATRVLQDPWDMSERTDLGWFTFGVDQPPSNLTNMQFSGGIFSATPGGAVPNDPSFWLLDPPTLGRVQFGKDGQTYPIDTSRYGRLLIRMRLATGVNADGQVLWNVLNSNQGNVVIPFLSQGWRVYVFNLAGQPNWTGFVDSLRVDPTTTAASGQVDVDWARLVDTSKGSQTITWTGGGTYDVFISDTAGCVGNVAKIALNQGGGSASFYAAGLPPGNWYVGMAAAGAPAPTTCSTGFFQVSGVPTLSFTSPSDEGSSDDFATALFGATDGTWDPIDNNDLDFARNINGLGMSAIQAQTEAGASLGAINVLSGTSAAGTGSTGLATCSGVTFNVGDPHVYPLWYQPMPGARARGATTRIDTNRYRILTFEQAIPRARDLCRGSVARIVWKVAGEAQENVTSDILLHHLDPNDTVSPNLVSDNTQVFQKITLDMADRTKVPLEPGAPAQSGWVNGSTSNPGLDNFRIDFHEFGDPTAFFLRRVRLAALEQADTSYGINLAVSNPSGVASTVSLFDDTDASGFDGTPISECQNLTTASCTWNTTSLTHGTLHYLYAVLSVGGSAVNQVYARWPVKVFHPGAVPPTLTLDRTTLRFNVVRGSVMTPAQTVTVGQTGGTGILSWTASSNASWLQVLPTAGSGAGLLTIQLNPSDPTLQAFGTHTGRITVVGAGSNTIAIDVTMTVNAPGSTTAPFGQVDTPVQHATGVQGAIGVTGWALDDVAVGSVKIYRNCLAFDPAGACGVINGVNLVFVGDAAFVPGARTDLEAAFSAYPQAHRAGWGYLMLTNMLPNVSSGLGFGGQGNLTIYAFATDAEGNRRLLGRAWHFTEPGATDATQITMANASIAKPFGAIDTPGQGQTVSGMLANFGWALTPDGNTIADAGDILIATNGSTMNVVIDGAAVGTVQYNQCRGSVGNPVPAGAFCDDDVASIFGHPTPQPGLTPRTSNPTRFRNLDAGRAVIGAFDIDTRTLPNGRHSIAWGVLDSAGRAEGIGSRDFIVLNGAALRAGDQTASIDDAAAMNLGDATEVTARPLSAVTVWGRTGFDFTRPVDEVRPHSSTGMRHVRIPELGRLELWLGEGVTAGYLVANGQLRALPPGSWLDVASGRFTWGPLVGYIGPYDLVFLDGEAQIPVRVTLEPKTSETAGLLRGYIDLPAPQATVSGPLTVAGWALDTGGWQGSGVGAVHVWAHRVDMAAAPAVFLGAAELGVVRPDVAAAFGAYAERAGWQLVAPGLAPGIYDVVAYFWSTRTDRFEDARTVRITVR